MKRRLGYQVCCAIAALWALPQAAHAVGIATVTDVVNEGYRTPPGADEVSAKTADELVQNEGLRTEAESVIQVQFVDGSLLSVEQSSEMVLSDYVFDGSATAGLINLNDGLFHFRSGQANDQGVKLRTPVATIGVRGTEFLVHVDGDDVTIIDILDGAVEATPHGSGRAITCEGGQSILVAGPDADAVCGDIGSFSTAAGPANNDGPDGGTKGGNGDKENTQIVDRPEPEPEPVDPPTEEPPPHECPPGDWGNYEGPYYKGPYSAALRAPAEETPEAETPEGNQSRPKNDRSRPTGNSNRGGNK